MGVSIVRIALASLLLFGCKDKQENGAKTEPKGTTATTATTTADKAEPTSAWVKPDLAAIDKALASLADATVSKGLPEIKANDGIACGESELVKSALAHIGIEASTLQSGKGFLFQDVCIGWRPFVHPVREMYWLIAAGELPKDQEVMPVRRCVRLNSLQDKTTKADIVDGPCLTIHTPRAEPEATP